MTIHDAYARLTPYELSFPNVDWARDAFTAVRGEADARGVDRSDPALFILLGSVGRMLQEIRPDEEDPERIHPHGLLLFHAFHFWEAGEPVFLLEVPVARRLVESAPSASWRGWLPSKAGYLQLPQHLFWMEGEDGAAPESVDGFFWTAPEPAGEIHVLLAVGIRADRPGFSVVPLPPASLERAEEWADVPGREGEADFVSRMPGAELERLYRLGTPGEVLKLVSRAFAFIDQHPPEASTPVTGVTSAPRPTQLAYKRVGPG